jgi:hypothetical protein
LLAITKRWCKAGPEWLNPGRLVEKVGGAGVDGMLTTVLTANALTNYLVVNQHRYITSGHVQRAFLSETPKGPIPDGIVALDRSCGFGCLDAERGANPSLRIP